MSELAYHWGLVLEVYPSFSQRQMIRRNSGCYRFVYNRMVALNNELYCLRKINRYLDGVEDRKNYLDSVRHSAQTIKNSAPFLYEDEIDSDIVANAILNYRVAWKNMKTNHTGVPVFHKKGNNYFYKTSNHYSSKSNEANLLLEGSIRFLDKNHLHLPKLGRIRFKGSRKLVDKLFNEFSDARIGSCRIEIDETDHVYVSLSLASDRAFYETYESTGKSVGSDLNLENFLYDSDGNEISNPRNLIKAQKKLIKQQRQLSRKQTKAKKKNRDFRSSKSYNQNRIKLAKTHKHIANQRKDFHFVEANRLVKTHDLLFFEDLKVKNLMKNHKLAKAISDVGWSSFLARCEWTAIKRGKTFKKVARHFTTQTCNACGYVLDKEQRLGLGDREWVCPNCSTYHVRDYNAAINILKNGLAELEAQIK